MFRYAYKLISNITKKKTSTIQVGFTIAKKGSKTVEIID